MHHHCEDIIPSDYSYCKTFKWMCTDDRYPWFGQVCKKTCNLCPGKNSPFVTHINSCNNLHAYMCLCTLLLILLFFYFVMDITDCNRHDCNTDVMD